MDGTRLYEGSLGRSWATALFPDRGRSLRRGWVSMEGLAVGEAGRGTVAQPAGDCSPSRMATKSPEE